MGRGSGHFGCGTVSQRSIGHNGVKGPGLVASLASLASLGRVAAGSGGQGFAAPCMGAWLRRAIDNNKNGRCCGAQQRRAIARRSTVAAPVRIPQHHAHSLFGGTRSNHHTKPQWCTRGARRPSRSRAGPHGVLAPSRVDAAVPVRPSHSRGSRAAPRSRPPRGVFHAAICEGFPRSHSLDASSPALSRSENSAATKSLGSKVRRSSMPSPTPT